MELELQLSSMCSISTDLDSTFDHVEKIWRTIKNAYADVAENVLGFYKSGKEERIINIMADQLVAHGLLTVPEGLNFSFWIPGPGTAAAFCCCCQRSAFLSYPWGNPIHSQAH